MKPHGVMKAFAWSTVALAVVLTGVTWLFSGERDMPTSADVRELTCRYVPPEGVATIYATVRNSTDEPRDYEVGVYFETVADVRVGSGVIVVRDAEPGQDVKVQTTGEFVPGAVPARCGVS